MKDIDNCGRKIRNLLLPKNIVVVKDRKRKDAAG